MSEKAIKTPLPNAGLGWTAIDQQEIDAVTNLLKTPEKLFRYDEGCLLYTSRCV